MSGEIEVGSSVGVGPQEVEDFEKILAESEKTEDGKKEDREDKNSVDQDAVEEAEDGSKDTHEEDEEVDEEDGSSVKNDEELSAAGNETERQQIRQRRREERSARRKFQRERADRLEREVSSLRGTVTQLNEALQSVTSQTFTMQLHSLDASIGEAERAAAHFRSIEADAISKGDGQTAADASEKRTYAAQRATELKGLRERVMQPNFAQGSQRGQADPDMVRQAKSFLGKHKWYGGPQATDEDSMVLSTLDAAVTKAGFDPRTQEYWSELESRAKRYLPHRFSNSGTGKTGDDPQNSGRRQQPAAQRRQPVSDGSGGGARRPSGQYNLSAERVAAMKEAGMWDDPEKRAKMIARYKQMDSAKS